MGEINTQLLLNSVLGVLAFLAAWVLKLIWDKIDALEKDVKDSREERSKFALFVSNDFARKSEVDAQLIKMTGKVERLESLEVILASQYVTKTDFTRLCDQMLAKLDRIDEKLDNKADRKENN